MVPSAERTILVIDDEPTLLRLVARVLRKEGYHVLETPNRQEALAAFAASPEPVCAVVVDLHLRPEGGVDVLRTLLARSPALGVVVTSGTGLDAAARRFLDGCAGEFLHKPFAPESLLQALSRVVASRSAEPA